MAKQHGAELTTAENAVWQYALAGIGGPATGRTDRQESA